MVGVNSAGEDGGRLVHTTALTGLPSRLPEPSPPIYVSNEAERLLRTTADRFLDARPQRFGWTLLLDHELIVLAHPEDLRGQAHAHGVALAELPVHHDSHPALRLIALTRTSQVRYCENATPTKETAMSVVPTPTTTLSLDEINLASFDFWMRDDVDGALAKLRHERPDAWHE